MKHRRLTTRAEAHVVHRLAVLLCAGVPLVESLDMLAHEARVRSMRALLHTLTQQVSCGQSLATAMRESRAFAPISIAMVAVGESSGSLPESLRHLADELSKRERLRKTVQGALIYPAVIVVSTIGIAVGLVSYLFPKIIPIFRSLGHELPWSTRVMMSVSDALVNHTPEIIIVLALCLGVGVYALSISTVRAHMDALAVRLPIVGAFVVAYNLSSLARTLATLLRGGMQVVPALRAASESVRHVSYRRALAEAAEHVACGQALAASCRTQSRIFPPLFTQMIAVGERTGTMAETFTHLAGTYEEEVSDRTRSLTTLLEPLLMIGMGLVVGFIAISIITPIYGITQNVYVH